MGFYGNIKNTSRTQFSFDKVYPNRAEMDDSVRMDGIYAGRFVLVEYDDAYHTDLMPRAVLKDDLLYPAIPSLTDGVVQPYTVGNENGNTTVKAGTIVVVEAGNNFDDPDITYNQFFQIQDSNKTVKNVIENGILMPVYKNGSPVKYKLYAATDLEEKYSVIRNITGAKFKEFLDEDATSANDAFHNYSVNFNLDKARYGVARGYDSTVWQKTYNGNDPKYVMVAELNSVVPTFALSSDPPSLTPSIPHFDVDSTNVYYNLHWQPQWGFRVKSNNPKLQTPKLNSLGESQQGDYVNASTDEREYPSDETTAWTNTLRNSTSGDSTERYLDISDGSDQSSWVTLTGDAADALTNTKIPAAIYFNKAGFNPEKITYSDEEEYNGWEDFKVSDEIAVKPTGRSGHSYNTHGDRLKKDCYPDTQELSIMLPSLGDTMAEIWDLIYGGRQLNAQAKYRNTDVSWRDAKAVSPKDGHRLIRAISPGHYTYDVAAGGTVAGVMNTMQDLLGMIITDEMPNNVATANGDYIYYDAAAQKYKFKHKTYNYTAKTFTNNTIPENYTEANPQTLKQWDKSYMYIDSATNAVPEFVLENEFYPDRAYLPVSTVQNSMSAIKLSDTYTADGSYFQRYTGNYSSSSGSKGYEYQYFAPCYAEYSSAAKYYSLTNSDKNLKEKEKIYIPSYYYYVEYEYVGIPEVYKPHTYWYKYSSSFKDGKEIIDWRPANGETIDDNKDISEKTPQEKYNEKVNSGATKNTEGYYKRTYYLDTAMHYTPGRVYFTVDPEENNESNAYYVRDIQVKAAGTVSYDEYRPKSYFYIVSEEPSGDGVYYKVDGKFYLRDDEIYSNNTEYTNSGKTYYTVEEKLVLSQGQKVIQITDDNAIQIDTMRDLNEFKTYDSATDSGTDVFYVSKGNTPAEDQYVVVTYNNIFKSWNSATSSYEVMVKDYTRQGAPYSPNTYYYQVENTTVISISKDGFTKDVFDAGTYYFSVKNKPTEVNGVKVYALNDIYYVQDTTNYASDEEFQKVLKQRDYFKIIETTNKNGSFLIDDSYKLVEGRKYYQFKPIAGVNYNGELLTQYYAKNTYWVETTSGSGIYEIAQEVDYDSSKTYYTLNNKLYVISDTNGLYKKGAEWPEKVTKIPSGVTLGSRTDAYELAELPGLGEKLLTVHGILLALYKNINEADDLTRDDTTVRGVVNQLNDLIRRFAALIPGQLVLTDSYGRVHSAKLSTAQALTFKNNRIVTQSTKENAILNQATKENALITVKIDDNFKQPKVHIYHSSANTVSDVTDTYNLNSNGDILQLYHPIVDNAGHVVGSNIKSVTLPYGFKYITPKNSSAVTQLTTNSTQIVADNTQDNFDISAENKWIRVASKDNIFKIAHEIVDSKFANMKSNGVANGELTQDGLKKYYTQDNTPKFGDTFNIPVITVDNAGHIRAFETETVKIPKWSFTNDDTSKKDVVVNMAYTYDANKDEGILTETRANVDTLTIQDYKTPTSYTTDDDQTDKLTNAMTIHGAFAKLQKQIDDMDYTFTSKAGYYLYKTTQHDGKITVAERALPTVTDTNDDTKFVSEVSESLGAISVKRRAFDVSLSFDTASDSKAQKLTVSVAGNTSSATIAVATTGVYGVTKLTSSFTATDEALAMNGKAVNEALKTLNVTATTLSQDKTIKSISEADGKISVTTQSILITDANVSASANIAQSKIKDLVSKLQTMVADTKAVDTRVTNLTGNSSSASDSYTVYGLRARIDGINTTLSNAITTINNTTIPALKGSDSDTKDSVSIAGAKKYTDDIVSSAKTALKGNTTTTSTTITISNAIKMVEDLTARVKTLEDKVKKLEGTT